MKKFAIVCLITSAITLGIGVICCTAGAAMGVSLSDFLGMVRHGDFAIWAYNDWDEEYWGDDWEEDWGDDWDNSLDESGIADIDLYDSLPENSEGMEMELPGLTKLEMEISAGTVEIILQDNETVPRLEAKGYLKKFDFKQGDNGTYEFKDHTKKRDRYKKAVRIYLPTDYSLEELEISLGAGQVKVGDLQMEEFDIMLGAGYGSVTNLKASRKGNFEVGAGELVVKNYSGGETELDCGVGKLDFQGKSEGNIDVNCGIGTTKLKLDNAYEDFDYELECGIGTIHLNGESFTSLGREKNIINHGPYQFKMECGIGSIDVTTNSEEF